ncbi:MAG: hypothetical protein HGA49_11775 [Eubacteriaceae bacterium]|nr:hypothetical protein [Eubacteriaceae bacterium]
MVSTNVNKDSKKRLIIILAVIVLILAAGIFMALNSRYFYIYNSINTLQKVSSYSGSFDIEIGEDGSFIKSAGTGEIIVDPGESYFTVETKTALFPLKIEIYTRGEDTYFRSVLTSDQWIMGNLEDSGAIGITGDYKEKLKALEMMDIYKAVSIMDKSDEGDYMLLSTNDAFTVEQLEMLLSGVLPLSPEEIKKLNIKAYDFKFYFDRKTKIIHTIHMEFQSEIDKAPVPFEIKVILTGYNNIPNIETPQGIK